MGLMERESGQLEAIFRQAFFEKFQTLLIGGADEPLYQPAANPGDAHRLFYREDYFSSALHEIAHWCIAGEERRKLLDFGYWYNPDGRTTTQQRAFEQVEIKPQALEWIFTRACGQPFRVSADNLSSDETEARGPSEAFLRAVEDQAASYCLKGLPSRANAFAHALISYYGSEGVFDAESYLGALTCD
jgi:elongation factor P hydroxylase